MIATRIMGCGVRARKSIWISFHKFLPRHCEEHRDEAIQSQGYHENGNWIAASGLTASSQ